MSRRPLYAILVVALVVSVPLASAGTNDPLAPPTIDSGPSNPSNSRTATFTFHDANADPTLTLQCQLGDQSPTDCTSGTVTYPSLVDGPYSFGVKAIVGPDESAVTSYAWLIDTTPPPAPTITVTPRPNDDTPSFEFIDEEAKVTFSCRLDSREFSACKSPKNYAHREDGSHTFRVRATDRAGNTSSVTRYTWTIDTVAPVLAITQKPPDPSRDSTARFEFSATDATAVTFRCQLDTSAVASCSSPLTFSGLAPGVHTFTARATDAAGNVSNAASYGWAVADTLAPGDVRRIKRSVGYRLLKLAWSRPPDQDFKRVRVFVSKGQTGAKAHRRTLVYDGPATHYTKKRYDNGTYHRYTIVTYDSVGNASNGVIVVVRPSLLLTRPRAGGLVHTPPALAWAGVRGARYYNVQLYRRGEKILSVWPNRPRLVLHGRWRYAGRSFRMERGLYAWLVWPAFGGRTHGHYGPLLGTSSFTVR